MKPLAISLALLAAPAALAAQLPDNSTRSLGMGGAYTALARGFEAVSWNPALLAARGRPGLSISLPAAQFEFGSNAYGFGDFNKYSEEYLTDADKQLLLDKVDSTLEVRTIVGVTPFALQIGPFAMSLGTSGDAFAGLGRDAVELMLFGNASRSGPGQYFTAAGSNARGWAATTLAGSFALPLPLPIGRVSAGVTVKKIWGHALGVGRELNSQLGLNPNFTATARGHVIYTDYDEDYDFEGFALFDEQASPGSGFGLDLGGVWDLSGGLRISATMVNAIGSMSWDESRFRYDRVTLAVTQDGAGNVSDTLIKDSALTVTAINADPEARALRDTLLAHANFAKLLRAGVSLRLGGLRVGADAQIRLSEGLDRQPSQAVAVGAEYVLLGILPLRAGVATDFGDALTLSAGTGLHLGPVKFDIGASNTEGSDRPGVRVGAGIGLIF